MSALNLQKNGNNVKTTIRKDEYMQNRRQSSRETFKEKLSSKSNIHFKKKNGDSTGIANMFHRNEKFYRNDRNRRISIDIFENEKQRNEEKRNKEIPPHLESLDKIDEFSPSKQLHQLDQPTSIFSLTKLSENVLNNPKNGEKFRNIVVTKSYRKKYLNNRLTFTFEEWVYWINTQISEHFGNWKALEDSKVLDGSNNFRGVLEDNLKNKNEKSGQFRAQYGRCTSTLVETCIREAKIIENDRVIDIGSGIGTVVLQIASTIGCPSIGIELLKNRHNVATHLKEIYDKYCFIDRPFLQCGPINFICGDFTSSHYRKMITSATVLFVNNAQGTFEERCVDTGKKTLNYFVASLFRQTNVGSRLIALEPILYLQSEELSQVFEVIQVKSLPESVAWSAVGVEIYIYTKISETWSCKRCTTDNKLYNELYEPITTCAVCWDDENGMKRDTIILRKRKKSEKN